MLYSFTDPLFFYFFALLIPIYWLLNRKVKLQNFILLIASYLFYAIGNLGIFTLFLLSTIVNYLIGLWIFRVDDNLKKKRVLVVGIVINVIYLGFFKYLNFFIDSFVSLFNLLGLSLSKSSLSILLPIGISFYTFQAISFLVDLYKGTLKSMPSVLNFGVYMAFFPKIVAGPIERAEPFISQLNQPKTFDMEKASSGFQLILIGMFKKVVVADIIAVKIQDFFSNPARYGSATAIFAIFLYTLQIYADFSGYSNMARGFSKFLGINLIKNFDYPYLATNLREFWRGWHISLSTWIRDYIYIPLGGSRGGKKKTYKNSLYSMLIAGIWHGAGLTFIFWGFLHGIYLIINRKIQKPPDPDRTLKPNKKFLIKASTGALTFILVTIAWVFFRASSFKIALSALKQLFVRVNTPFPVDLLAIFIFSSCILFILDFFQKKLNKHEIFGDLPWYFQGIIYAIMIYMIVIWNVEIYTPFIYAGF